MHSMSGGFEMNLRSSGKPYQLGDDPGHTGLSGQGESTLLHNLGVALLIRVLHGDHDLGRAGVADQVHSTTEALDLSGQHPVGEITSGAHLHGTEDGQVDATTPDHAETLLAPEYSSTGLEGDGLLSGVDQVGILLTLSGVGAQTQDTVL